MQVKLLRSVVTSKGVHDVKKYNEKGKDTGEIVEEIVDLPDGEAKALIARGVAEKA